MFWEVQFGVMHAWLFADDPEDAGQRAINIAEELPYEPFVKREAQPQTWSVTIRPPQPSDPEEFAPHEKFARETGFSMCMDYCPVGVDEVDFAVLEPR